MIVILAIILIIVFAKEITEAFVIVGGLLMAIISGILAAIEKIFS